MRQQAALRLSIWGKARPAVLYPPTDGGDWYEGTRPVY
jgi:hypothetical protein